jgi:chromosomal replication initiation ATPase DnaA
MSCKKYKLNRVGAYRMVIIIAKSLNINPKMVFSPSMKRPYADARLIAYGNVFPRYIESSNKAGDFFNRNHATLLQGIKKCNILIETNKEFLEKAKLCRRGIDQYYGQCWRHHKAYS